MKSYRVHKGYCCVISINGWTGQTLEREDGFLCFYIDHEIVCKHMYVRHFGFRFAPDALNDCFFNACLLIFQLHASLESLCSPVHVLCLSAPSASTRLRGFFLLTSYRKHVLVI